MRVRQTLRCALLALVVAACGGNAGSMQQPMLPVVGAAGVAGAATPAAAGSGGDGASSGGVGSGGATTAVAGSGAAGSAPDPTGFDGVRLLSQTGLYSDTAARTLAPGVIPYEPLGQLWADGAAKRRWAFLPPGTTIDSSNMDAWRYPSGTKLWKEFAVDGVPIETRLIEKLPDGQWRMVSYAWNAERTEANVVPLGVVNAAGTAHDVPDTEACKQCHEGVPDRVLGFTALQLSHAGGGMTMQRLVAEGKLTKPPAAPLQLPGDATAQAALAYLHANCGHCHRPDRKRAEREISVYFWQEVGALADLKSTVTYTSLVKNKSSALWLDSVLARMQNRGGIQQMPPLATKQVDAAGIATVTAWLNQIRADLPPSPMLAPVPAAARCEGVEQIFSIFERAACRSAFCHGAGTGELDFTTPEQLHASMVGVRASGEGCSDLPLPRVQPGDPEHSLLLIKLRPGPPCGKIMPPAAIQALTAADVQAVSDWIARCAP